MQTILQIPRTDGQPFNVELADGETLFVLGANGTGKSSLLQRLATNARHNARRIAAHRQTWLQSNALTFAPSQKETMEKQVRTWDSTPQSRWMEQNAGQRASITLYDLIDAENVEARSIANAIRSGDIYKAQELARKQAPIAKINELLALSGIPVAISVEGGDRLMASKGGSTLYGAAELSDGERNALLIAADVLTAKPETLLVIDEPERHLHRSIISPLLTQLFQYRRDCSFVVASHDLMLPVDNPDAKVLLVRSCKFSGQNPVGWDVDLLAPDADIDDALRQDILGARRQLIFVEGEDSSLDKPLYSILFPGASVRAKRSSRDIEHSVRAIRAAESVAWLRAWGVVDNDGRDREEVAELHSQGIFALPFFSVESIYYHPDVISGVAARQSTVIGGDGDSRTIAAIDAAIDAVLPHLERLAARGVEKALRRRIYQNLPTQAQIREGKRIVIDLDTDAIVKQETDTLNSAASEKDWLRLITRCPVRETPALDAIARAVGLRNRHQYEAAVLQMLRGDSAFLSLVRGFFEGLCGETGSPHPSQQSDENASQLRRELCAPPKPPPARL